LPILEIFNSKKVCEMSNYIITLTYTSSEEHN
jgi:hypothetical protein